MKSSRPERASSNNASTAPAPAPALRDLLDLCDELYGLRQRVVDVELTHDLRTRLRRKVRNRHQRLVAELERRPLTGPVGRALGDLEFSPIDFEILAALLHRRLVGLEPYVCGRELLRSAGEGSFDMLDNLWRLGSDAPLRRSAFVDLDQTDAECGADDHPEDLLDSNFRLSELGLRAFDDELRGKPPTEDEDRLQPFSSNHEVLVDLRLLHNLYKLRSERAFALERWDRTRDRSPSADGLDRRIEAAARRLQQRLAVTPDVDLLPVVRFQREHQLDEHELIVIAHLLFREVYEGNAYADAAELIRLVSKDDVDLLRNRRLMLESGRLRKFDILQVEAVLEGRALTGEVHLSDWAVNYLFGATNHDEQIGSDDRLDWHLYLKNLDDTRAFFRDLDAN